MPRFQSINEMACWLAVGVFSLTTSTAWGQAQDLDPDRLAIVNSAIKRATAVDVQLAGDLGLSIFSGRHLILFSDLRDDGKTRDLVNSYDAAVPQWCRYFGVDPQDTNDWKLRAFLIRGPGKLQRFQQANLIRENLPDFAAGYQEDFNIYLYDQPGPYYTRHLLLHEGTHAFMQWFLNGPGAPWYSEGLSEYAAVHRRTKNSVELFYRLHSRDEAPYWGRVKTIREEFASGDAMTLDDVLAIPYNAFRSVRFYSWSWAACEFFDQHPLSQQAFRELKDSTTLPPAQFNQLFKAKIKDNWRQLSVDWALYISEMEYGANISTGRVTPATKSKTDPNAFMIASDRSWQSTEIRVQAGDQVSVHANGRFQVGRTNAVQSPVSQVAGGSDTKQGSDAKGGSGDKSGSDAKTGSGSKSATAETDGEDPMYYPWHCEANGITIEYYRGQPLGMLQAGVLTDSNPSGRLTDAPLMVIPVGGGEQKVTMPESGFLCFRINESPAKLEDNVGALDVRCKRLQ